MNSKGIMERRYSLTNSPRLTNPIADSTWIDGMPSTHRPAARQLYRNLSTTQRSHSSSSLSNSITNGTPSNSYLHQMSRTSMGISKMTRQKLNLSQLDPKTYADVHSSGFTSRIAGYQKDVSHGLQRSMSYSNVYKPFVQQRRIATPHKGVLPSVSITRIAPPERSLFCGNTLPSLMRSNSLLGVEKSSEQLSRENRPILHPPPLQHESEPTRSVLEELKEISRKRINSGELQPNDYKKSCNRMTDYVDHHHHHHHAQQQNQQQQQPQQQQQQQLPMLQMQSGIKRQRELTVAVPLRQYHSPMSLAHQQHLHQQQQQHHYHQQLHQMPGYHYSMSVSPEQMAKRRNCSHSNEIAGSLSSSKLHSSKRKLYDTRQAASTVNGSSSSSSPENSPRQQAAKIQCNQSTVNLHLDHLARTQSVPITPLPATPAQRTVSAPEPNFQARPQPETPTRPKLTLFNAAQPQRHQPQLQEAPREQQLDLDSPDVDASEYAGIQFVKPKQQNSMGTQKNLNLERTQKTKLALMLSSLKGEIYQDELELPDEPDAMPKTLPTPINPTTIATSTMTTLTTATSTTTTTKPIILSVTTIVPATIDSTTTNTSTAATKTTPNTSESMFSLNNTSATGATATATTTLTTIASNNTLPLLSFNKTSEITASKDTLTNLNTVSTGTLSDVTLPTTTSKTITSTSTSVPKLNFTPSTIGSGTMPPAINFNQMPSAAVTTTTSVASPTSTATNTTPMFSFGNASATNATTTSTATSAASALFSFGKLGAAQTTFNGPTAAAATTATSSASTPMFSFGNPAAAATTTATATTTAAAITPVFSFGKAAATPTTMASTTTPTAAAIKPFTFGSTTNIDASSGSALKLDNWASKPTEPSGAFNNSSASNSGIFGSAAPSTTTAEPVKLFSFGNNTQAAAPAVTPVFGAATAGTSTEKPAFSFGGAPAAAATTTAAPAVNSTPNLFSFGGSSSDAATPVAKALPFTLNSSNNNNNNNNNNLFNFGGGDAPTTTTTTSTVGAPAPAANFNFNAPTTNGSNRAFSFNATTKPAPMFGSSSINNNDSNGTATKPFAFGSATQQQTPAVATQATQQQQRTGGFSFAAVAQKNDATNIFSSPTASTAAAVPATGIVKPSFNFGGNNSAPTAVPSFGGFAVPAAPTNNQSKPFAFGASSTNNNTSTPIGGNLFASAVAAAQQQSPQQSKPGGFSFNNSSSSSTAAPPAASGNAPFAFGGITSPSQSNNGAKPFTFGASANNNATGSNIFGSTAGAATPAGPTSNGAFNFGGATAAPNMPTKPQQLNSGNVFAPPSTPEPRPIRRATRRLQK